ncbi:MAG: DUF58 domain-containing protein [Kiritimatiellia bacterium]
MADLHTPSYMRWLPPATTATITRLDFLARGIVDGFISGKHRSPRKGFSVEFAEHRQYVPGDDLRNLDWKVVGKKDRYYIKQYIEETNLRATILLDASGSMAYCGDKAAEFEGRRLSKFEYAKYLAAALAYLLVGQQDAVGMVTFDTAIRDYLPAKSRASQVRQILEMIDAAEPRGDSGVAAVFNDIAERIPHRGLVVIVSDLFDNLAEVLKALHHFRYRRHEVVLLHVMADEEITFPFDSFTEFRDLESTEAIQTDPRAVRASYLEQVRRFLKEVAAGCGKMDADYVPMNTSIPFEKALSDYLARRRIGG